MGTCYYLIREDNRTGYALGKCPFGWAEVLGNGELTTVGQFAGAIDLLTDLLTKEAVESGWHVNDPAQIPAGYLHDVAADIADWAEGFPFRFISEHADLYESIAWDDRTVEERDGWLTGDRHTTGMRRLAAKRAEVRAR